MSKRFVSHTNIHTHKSVALDCGLCDQSHQNLKSKHLLCYLTSNTFGHFPLFKKKKKKEPTRYLKNADTEVCLWITFNECSEKFLHLPTTYLLSAFLPILH